MDIVVSTKFKAFMGKPAGSACQSIYRFLTEPKWLENNTIDKLSIYRRYAQGIVIMWETEIDERTRQELRSGLIKEEYELCKQYLKWLKEKAALVR